MRITTNLPVADIEGAKDFYTGYLGLSTEEFNLGWVARFSDTETGAHVQLVTGDLTAPEDSSISVHTDDVDAAYREAQERGYEIVHSLTTEEWGVRRFHVRAPDGTVVNVVAHRAQGPSAPSQDRSGGQRDRMISVDEYLRQCDRALDAYAAIVTELGDDLVNARLDGIPGSNSAFVLVAHVQGMTANWVRTVNRGTVVPRDRPAEFTATGTVGEALRIVAATRALLHEDARAASPCEQPANPDRRRDGSMSYATQGEVLLHVYEELAQHLGQLEVTRDVLLATRAAGGAGTA